jgi:hypothetical protein
MIPPNPSTEVGSALDTNLLANLKADPEAFLKSITEKANKLQFPAPERLPCANVDVDKYKACPNNGTMACSACKLTSYCSKVIIFSCRAFTYFNGLYIGVSEGTLAYPQVRLANNDVYLTPLGILIPLSQIARIL